MNMLSVLIGLVLGNRIKAARYRRAVDLGYHDGFWTGRTTAPSAGRRKQESP